MKEARVDVLRLMEEGAPFNRLLGIRVSDDGALARKARI